jgi:hypothetical protein
MTSREKKDKAWAVLVTLGVSLLILLILIYGALTFNPELTRTDPTAQLQEEEEEFFIEPELLELGEDEAVSQDAPAPAVKGEPEPAEEENPIVVVPDKNPKPAPQIEKPITQKKESSVKATTPPKTDKERKKATSAVAKGFSGRNGVADGKNADRSGSGGAGVGISGNARGRTFISCPKPDVALRHKTVVVVNIVVNAAGNVISAHASGSADAGIRRKCEQAAMRARWSEKKGAGETRGTLTFTITPR